jgi:hypothetical protein
MNLRSEPRMATRLRGGAGLQSALALGFGLFSALAELWSGDGFGTEVSKEQRNEPANEICVRGRLR